MARTLVASGALSGVDHETFGSNELMHEPVRGLITLTEQDLPQVFYTMKKGWGGECRLEVILTAKLLNGNSIQVDVNGKLFEGNDEATDQLEEEKTGIVVVPRSVPTPFSMTLYNSAMFGIGGGDSGTIDLTFMNTPAED